MDQKLRTFLVRIGAKTRLRKLIYQYMPDDFDIYIEPYLGGGAIFLGYSFKPNQKIILNDMDTKLISMWKLLQKGVDGDIEKYKTTNIKKLTKLRDTKSKKDLDILVSFIINSSSTYGSTGVGKIYNPYNPYNKLKKMDDYKKKLKNVQILNKSYDEILKKYDNKNAFFYLDPPYENSKNMYKHEDFNYINLASNLKKIKGKFMLSINYSKNIADLFKDFKLKKVVVKSVSHSGGLGINNRKELIITNY